MSDQKPRIGKSGGGREVAKMFSEIRNKPTSKLVLEIVKEIGDSKKKQEKKIAKPKDAET